MVKPMVKSTYVLDPDTAGQLDRLAREWHVSTSEALRRVIRSAAATSAPDTVSIFRQLQHSVTVNRAEATAWAGAVRAERKATRSAPRKCR